MAKLYFSDVFDVSADQVKEYGAFDVSLVGDLPLFVDPFLLFNSSNPTYQRLHEDIIKYVRFLRDESLGGQVPPGLLERWYCFPEVRQNWLGFSKTGNRGHGLGNKFAVALNRNLGTIFQSFGSEKVTQGSHLEKLCLIRSGVGRDNISDFTTNLIKGYLAEYTQEFSQRYLRPQQRKLIAVDKVKFNYETRSWAAGLYELPFVADDYVLLTPRDILTRDDTWISRHDLLDRVQDIAQALPNHQLRDQINDYLMRRLPHDPTAAEYREAAGATIDKFPVLVDYYIREREERGDEALVQATRRVRFVEGQFVQSVQRFHADYLEPLGFHEKPSSSYEECMERVLFLKDIIENKGGHRVFYSNGKRIDRESDLHIMYRLIWFRSPHDVTREANDGRGPVDFKVSRGSADKTLVEFKLASNRQLKANLRKQTEVYEKASDPTHPTIKVIVFFSDQELARVRRILKDLGLEQDKNIVLIDASALNKPSGSKAR